MYRDLVSHPAGSLTRIFYKILLWLVDAGDIKIDLSAADFCLIDPKAVEAINALPEPDFKYFSNSKALYLSWVAK